MKTIKQWLQELPEPYRTEALDNYNDRYNPVVENIFKALNYGFSWSATTQGYEYWLKIYNSLYRENH